MFQNIFRKKFGKKTNYNIIKSSYVLLILKNYFD